MRLARVASVAGLSLSILLGSSFNPAAIGASTENGGKPDYEAAGKEATKILCDYLKVDTTNPPGNEKRGADFLAEIIRKEGLEAEVIELGKDRSLVVSRLKGSGKKKGIILMNHIDVVPAVAADWQHAPFGGEIHDGEIWGRGAIDMKGMGIIELEAFLMLKRSGVKLDRDIVFLATPDEEAGGDYGAGLIKEKCPHIVEDCEFVLNEGFSIEADDKGNAKYWGVDFAEKNICWFELTTKGDAGHASMPMINSSTNRLVRALNRIVNAGPNFRLLPEVEEYFTKISASENGELKKAYEDIKNSVKDKEKEPLLLSDLLKSSMLRNTISLTRMEAGYKTNVIPAKAMAQLDCRLLPDVKKDDFIAWMKNLINDPEVDVKVIDWQSNEPSKLQTELYETIKAVAKEENPNIPVVPVIVPWFTDSHWMRELGMTAYGFQPIEVDKLHLATMHGKDERLPIKSLENGVRRMHKILLKFCEAQ